MCRNTAKSDLEKLNSLITQRGQNGRRVLMSYVKFARHAKAEDIRSLALKNGDDFIEKLNKIDDLFTKIIENSGNKNWENMIGTGFKTSTPRKTLRTLLGLYLIHGSTIPPRQENEQITQATGEEKIQKVA